MSSSGISSRSEIPGARRIVVKVGSSSISGSNVGQIAPLVDALAVAHGRGSEVILVSSGAIATGIPYLKLDAERAAGIWNDDEGFAVDREREDLD